MCLLFLLASSRSNAATREVFGLEVVEDHAFFVSSPRFLVHNASAYRGVRDADVNRSLDFIKPGLALFTRDNSSELYEWVRGFLAMWRFGIQNMTFVLSRDDVSRTMWFGKATVHKESVLSLYLRLIHEREDWRIRGDNPNTYIMNVYRRHWIEPSNEEPRIGEFVQGVRKEIELIEAVPVLRELQALVRHLEPKVSAGPEESLPQLLKSLEVGRLTNRYPELLPRLLTKEVTEEEAQDTC